MSTTERPPLTVESLTTRLAEIETDYRSLEKETRKKKDVPSEESSNETLQVVQERATSLRERRDKFEHDLGEWDQDFRAVQSETITPLFSEEELKELGRRRYYPGQDEHVVGGKRNPRKQEKPQKPGLGKYELGDDRIGLSGLVWQIEKEAGRLEIIITRKHLEHLNQTLEENKRKMEDIGIDSIDKAAKVVYDLSICMVRLEVVEIKAELRKGYAALMINYYPKKFIEINTLLVEIVSVTKALGESVIAA